VIVYNLNSQYAGSAEEIRPNPEVFQNGSGTVQVLDSLKTGDREDLFHTIEAKLKEYIPEIEKLSFIPSNNARLLQVREKYIKYPIPASELSDGTKLVLIILTIIYQERPPSLICLEDIDHGIHPRLLQQVIQLCFDMAGTEGRPQIIATTHNPYVVDLFKGHEDAVILVEKENGYTQFIPLEERLDKLDHGENPLGELWYSGFVGGVPAKGN
jgi:predicted ATPase